VGKSGDGRAHREPGRAAGWLLRYGHEVRKYEPDVLVIGAGVAGLTAGVCLARAGLRVILATEATPQQTTSAVAGAIWGPHLVGMDDRVIRWSRVTLAQFREIAGTPAAGVHLASGIDAYRLPQPAPPPWTEDVGEREPCDGALPAGYASGWRFTAPVITMPVYLDYLLEMFVRAGGRLRSGRCFASLAAAADQSAAPVIVNCAGIGARDLVPDPAMVPVRGQVVVTANPGITDFFIGHGEQPGEVTYLFPHDGTVVLGGTEIAGDWSLEPDPDTATSILAACTAIEPRLRGAAVLAHRVGLRPVRPRVRLEAEGISDGRRVVHDYGHGGAGITLSWGCAVDVTEQVLRSFV
jgi:D-amino-acid oxidase